MNSAVEYHSRIASVWESNYSTEVFSIRERVLDEMLAGCDLTGQRWLDAGCGTGTLARFLAKRRGRGHDELAHARVLWNLAEQFRNAEWHGSSQSIHLRKFPVTTAGRCVITRRFSGRCGMCRW